jgi:hypothetical protein
MDDTNINTADIHDKLTVALDVIDLIIVLIQKLKYMRWL